MDKNEYKFNPFLPCTRSRSNPAETCRTCLHFDGSKHEHDARTAHAGICKRFSETTFKNDSCTQYLSLNNAKDWNSVTKKPNEQLKLL